MKATTCANCGSAEFQPQQTALICAYCHSIITTEAKHNFQSGAGINITGDIELLLRKCKDDPSNRRRYAKLILDMDPAHPEANKYLTL